jgi:hypothetical protein
MNSMKKALLFISLFALLASSAWCIKIDGKFWDWSNIKTFYNCPARPLEKDRAGFDMRSIKLCLGRKFLYIYIDGKSVTGLKPDRGWGAKKTSIRVSFRSAQSPLNRVRIATDPSKPGEIKVSSSPDPSREYGSKADKYWDIARYGKKYAVEMKIPIFYSSKGIHIGAKGRPLIKLSGRVQSSRQYLSEVLINTVDMKTHRLVDTVEFAIKKGEL